MSIFTDITDMVQAAPAHKGYAPTGARVPYVVSRPLLIDDALDRALSGDPIALDTQFSLYCCGASVAASYNLAVAVMKELDARPLAGTTLKTSMGYIGVQVEGHYESQVTVQLNQGGI